MTSLVPSVKRVVMLGAAGAATLIALGFSGPARAATFLTHAEATSQLLAAGITWSSSGNCSNRNNATCTSFEQATSIRTKATTGTSFTTTAAAAEAGRRAPSTVVGGARRVRGGRLVRVGRAADAPGRTGR
jgi:spermidine/putrescine-binding protein